MFSELINRVISKGNSEDLAKLENSISDFLESNHYFSVIEPFILGKGKRIRSILYFLNWNSDNSSLKKYKTAAMIEMIHFASILHDDVIDNNFSRRNGNSFLKEQGKRNSILFGDLLLVKAINELLKIHSDESLVKNFCMRECSAMAYGAVSERMLSDKSSLDDCLKVASLKTGALFKLSCFLGEYLSSGDFDKAKSAAIFGLCFGTIFQIQNDFDSYKSPIFSESEDFVQKNITSPILILRDFFDFDLERFFNSNQENYESIKQIIHSARFRNVTSGILKKLSQIVLSNEIFQV